MATEINVFDSNEFEELVSNRDLRISTALVETILKNLNGRKRHLHVWPKFLFYRSATL